MRLALSAVALLVFGAAAYFVIQSERKIARRLDAVRTFDQRSRAIAGELSAMRSAQQAYVAAGQGVLFWIPEVATLMASASASVDELRQAAVSPEAATALTEVAARISEFGEVDKRVREYLRSGEPLMAADVVFTEGGETAAAAGQQGEAARFAEQVAFDAFEADERRRQGYVLGAAAVCAVLILLLVAVNAPLKANRPFESAEANSGSSLLLREPAVIKPPEALPRDAVPALAPTSAG
jgi:CHASE3 domain sensor protein